MGDISSGAYAVEQRASARGLHVSTGHAQQLLAALIGHKTLAAFQTSGEPSSIGDAAHLLIDLDLAAARAGELGLPAEIVTVAAEALADELPLFGPPALGRPSGRASGGGARGDREGP